MPGFLYTFENNEYGWIRSIFFKRIIQLILQGKCDPNAADLKEMIKYWIIRRRFLASISQAGITGFLPLVFPILLSLGWINWSGPVTAKERSIPVQLDKPAFEILFRSFFPGLVLFAQKYVPDQDTAKEIVHNVFLNLWEKRCWTNRFLSPTLISFSIVWRTSSLSSFI